MSAKQLPEAVGQTITGERCVFPEPGIYPDIDPRVYHAPQRGPLDSYVLSKSMLWEFRKNPRRWFETPDIVPTKAMMFGNLVDVLTLTPQRFTSLYAVTPKTYPATESEKVTVQKPWSMNAKYCKEWAKEYPEDHKAKNYPATYPAQESRPKEVQKLWNWNANHCKEWRREREKEGKDAITPEEYAAGNEATKKLHLNDEFAAMMQNALRQCAFVAEIEEPESGMMVRVKCMLDIVPSNASPFCNAIVDLKEMAALNSRREIEAEVARRGYHFQGGLYRDVYNAATGEEREEFWLACQHPEPPNEVAVKPVDPDALLFGRTQYLRAIALWCRLVKVAPTSWPSPLDDIEHFELPAWAYNEP